MSAASLALLLSRVQFAFTVSFHIIFPAFTIGLGCVARVSGSIERCNPAPRLPSAV
jgi:cytochrome bd ubiquinol oxidase subunit I